MEFEFFGVLVRMRLEHLWYSGSFFCLLATGLFALITGPRKLMTVSSWSALIVCALTAWVAYPVSFLAHEFGHVFMNRYALGMTVTGVETTPVGFVARSVEIDSPERLAPGRMIASSLSGPVAGIGFSALVLALARRFPRGGTGRMILRSVGWTSVFLHAWNLTPLRGDGWWILQSVKQLWRSW